jgi:predicted nuclease of restriction endonuclease-like RecB superfamily
LITAYDLLLFALARGEYRLVYLSDSKEDLVEKLMDEFRERVGNELSDFVRSLEK